MASPTERAQWKQIMESLKSRERQVRSIQLKEDFKASNLMAPKLYQAIQSGSVQKLLLELEELCESVHVSDIAEQQVTIGGNTILHLAAKNRQPEILRLLAYHFPQLIIRRNITGDTALHFAARIMDVGWTTFFGILRFNQEQNVLRMKNELGNTALHEAVIAHNISAVRKLFEADKEVANYLNKEGKSPLYLAVETKQHGIVNLLLDAALFENRERHQGTSPLHAAIMVMNSGGTTIYKYASLQGRRGPDTISHPVFRPSTSEIEEIPPSPSSADGREEGETSDVERPPPITENETNTNWCDKIIGKSQKFIFLKDQNGRTALHFAASTGNLEGVRTILKASIESALEWDIKGYLPIHIACKKGHVHLVKQFLLQDQDPRFDPLELLNQKGQNLLHIAAKNGKETVVEYILNIQKLDNLLNERDVNGNTPLHLASKYMHPMTLHLITGKKALDVNLLNNKGMTARDMVVLKRSIPTTLREFLSLLMLESRGTPSSENGSNVDIHGETSSRKRKGIFRHLRDETDPGKWIQDSIDFMLIVAILIITVTFAAGFTVPGGINSSEDKSIEKIGMATSVNRKMFQLFTICDATAMYSATLAASILLWAHLGDFLLVSSATDVASYLVGFALINMSVAFMAALHLVVRNVSWLAATVIAIGVIFLLMFPCVYILLILPLGELNRHICVFFSNMISRLSRSYSKLRKVIKKLW